VAEEWEAGVYNEDMEALGNDVKVTEEKNTQEIIENTVCTWQTARHRIILFYL
jgi:hypothetical protein